MKNPHLQRLVALYSSDKSISFETSTTPSLEEEATGQVVREKEAEIYVEIADFNQLVNASSVDRQEQWSIKTPPSVHFPRGGQLRVRRVDDGATGQDIQYVLTGKIPQGKGGGDRLEVSQEVSQDVFDLFKCLAEKGMVKDRYYFPIKDTDLCWEIDVFPMADGCYAPWAKIDLENPPEALPPLPIQVKTQLDGRSNDPAVQAKIRELYDQYFLTVSI